MSHSEIFDYLVIGLNQWLQQEHTFPYPALFQRAKNMLALKMTTPSFPRTLTGFLSLLEQPVKNWYPLSVPKAFDADFGVVYEGRLSEEASHYFYSELLERKKLPDFASPIIYEQAIENYQFRELLERLQVEHEKNPEQAQQDYVLLRSFLIENPYVTTAKLRRNFGTGKARYLKAQDVGDLYKDCDRNKVCWNCDRCGPLIEKNGCLQGCKPSFCNDHRKSLPYVNRIARKQGLRRVKQGIHLRVCLPGIHELHLFQQMQVLQQENPEQLCSVLLYPGLDRYDLQLQFGDETVWAIDVKDYRNPYQLAAKLDSIYGEGSLQYDEGFYVFPQQRVRGYDDYMQIVRAKAKKLPKKTHILSDRSFEAHVIANIKTLKQGG